MGSGADSGEKIRGSGWAAAAGGDVATGKYGGSLQFGIGAYADRKKRKKRIRNLRCREAAAGRARGSEERAGRGQITHNRAQTAMQRRAAGSGSGPRFGKNFSGNFESVICGRDATVDGGVEQRFANFFRSDAVVASGRAGEGGIPLHDSKRWSWRASTGCRGVTREAGARPRLHPKHNA